MSRLRSTFEFQLQAAALAQVEQQAFVWGGGGGYI